MTTNSSTTTTNKPVGSISMKSTSSTTAGSSSTTPSSTNNGNGFHTLVSCYTRQHKPEVNAEDINAYDVICGRTKDACNNCGNKRFHVTIALNANKYIAANSRNKKTQIVMDITALIHSNGGRFLKRNGNRYKELSMKQARAKVGHALRDHLATQTCKRGARRRMMMDKNKCHADQVTSSSSSSLLQAKEGPQHTRRVSASSIESSDSEDCQRNVQPQHVSSSSSLAATRATNPASYPCIKNELLLANEEEEALLQDDDCISMLIFEADLDPIMMSSEPAKPILPLDSLDGPSITGFVRKLQEHNMTMLSSSSSQTLPISWDLMDDDDHDPIAIN